MVLLCDQAGAYQILADERIIGQLASVPTQVPKALLAVAESVHDTKSLWMMAGVLMQQRLAVARELARQTIEKRGEVATIEAIEREAAVIARGLYVERRGDEVTLTERALAEQQITDTAKTPR